jgi:5'-3' exonuclease
MLRYDYIILRPLFRRCLYAFRHMCILSGCDYAGSISGLGVKKAHALLKKYKDIEKVHVIDSLL